MSKRRYLPRETPDIPNSTSELPVHEPIAVYYRQSTDAQIGNVSTTMQTVDMIAHLKQRGWSDDRIIMIDMDGGISGTTKIDERPGMSMLYDLITEGNIRSVACQDEDRLFRDVTQIQVNIFIQACKNANVLVITPSMVYDFAHPTMGTFHARQFRFKSEMSAEYIQSYIKGRLHPAKMRIMMDGKWAGGQVPTGYMVDMRQKLPDGSENPNCRRYVPYPDHVEIVNEYFRIFLRFSGQLRKTARYIMENGPFFPDPETWIAPDGFKFVPPRIKDYGKGFSPGRTGLKGLLTNAAYIGHWAVNDVIVQWDNHEPIVPVDVFMSAFNYLSSATLTGKPNPNYRPVKVVSRSADQKRPVERPLCAGLIVTKHEGRWLNAGTRYVSKYKHYGYNVEVPDPSQKVLWWKRADYIDEAVSNVLKERLTKTFDPKKWEQYVDEVKAELGKGKNRNHNLSFG